MEWSTSCKDWEKRITFRQSLVPCGPLFPEEAEAALDVFKALCVVDVAGSPTFGEIGEPWLLDFVAAIFGAYDAERGRRLIREFFLCISKKNGKSTLAAGIMLTALIRNWRKSNDLIIVAPTIEAAQNSYKPAADMVRASPDLDASQGGFLHVQDHIRTIKHLTTKATLRVLAADASTVAGKKAAFVLIDELWELGNWATADAMLREATGGLVSRPEGFVISITTQSDGPPAGVFADKLEYARKVRDSLVEDRKFLPVIYEFPRPMLDSGAYLRPENFYITNPNIGLSVSQEWLEDELRKELGKDAGTRNTFLAKHLNVQIGMSLRADGWPGAQFWPAAEDAALTLEEILIRSEVVVVGIDGGGLDDLFGVCVLGRCRETSDWLCWVHAWCHASVLERRKSIAGRLQQAAGDGELTIVQHAAEDIEAIIELVDDINKRKLLACVAVDPAGIGELVDALRGIGVTQEQEQVIGVPQGYQLMNALKTAERKTENGSLKHAPSKLMDWCVGNLKIEPTATAIRATKQNAGDAKIDCAMAMFDAITIMVRDPKPHKTPEPRLYVI